MSETNLYYLSDAVSMMWNPGGATETICSATCLISDQWADIHGLLPVFAPKLPALRVDMNGWWTSATAANAKYAQCLLVLYVNEQRRHGL